MSIEAFTCDRPVVEIFTHTLLVGVCSNQIFEHFTLFYAVTGSLKQGLMTRHRPWRTAMRESARRSRMKREVRP